MTMKVNVFAALIIVSACSARIFPEHFLFGTSSNSYQIEGAWDTDGKGKNIWDSFNHNTSRHVSDGDVASDSYNKLSDDVQLLKNMGVNFYTFSLSWSRILPKGFSHEINHKGLHYYNTLINLLLKNNIEPMVALFCWDTPQVIEELGGFTNSFIVDWFEEYAKVAFENYGNRVKYWLTFNDPKEMCVRGYGGADAAPGYNSSGVGDYMCAHNVLKAHARVYHLYTNIYKSSFNGKISIGLGTNWYEAATKSTEDVNAAKRALDFSLGWFADPIYHPLGLYPKMMHKEIERKSLQEGFSTSRLPQFHKDEAKYIQGTYDFFALNHYATETVSHVLENSFRRRNYFSDRRVNVVESYDQNGNTSLLFKVGPQGFQKLLKHIQLCYQNPQIFITGNGFPDEGEIDDQNRIRYIENYLAALLKAIYTDEVNVAGYSVYSFMDGFEWERGYTVKYGLHYVNFTTNNRVRTPKASAKYYGDVIANRRLTLSDKNRSNKAIPYNVLPLLLLIILIFFK